MIYKKHKGELTRGYDIIWHLSCCLLFMSCHFSSFNVASYRELVEARATISRYERGYDIREAVKDIHVQTLNPDSVLSLYLFCFYI